MLYRQDIATRTPITQVELITILIVGLTIRSIWHNSAANFVAFWNAYLMLFTLLQG